MLRRTGRALFLPIVGFAVMLVFRLTLAPSHAPECSVEYSRLPRAEIEGDKVTISNLRNFDYPALADAPERGWIVVDMKNDWANIFAP